jgi:hypothetical protein
MDKLEIVIRKFPDGNSIVEYTHDTNIFVSIRHNKPSECLVCPSWTEDEMMYPFSCGNAISAAINLIEKELERGNQPKPLTAKEAFTKAYSSTGDLFTEEGSSVYKTIQHAVELYVTSQIEHLKKELQK